MENEVATVETIEQPNNEQAVNTENAEPIIEKVEERTFKQSEVDEMVKKRLEREQETTSKKIQQERDKWVQDQKYQSWDGKLITSQAEYEQAVKDQAVYNRHKDLPEDVVKELIVAEQLKEEKKTFEQRDHEAEQRRLDAEAFYGEYTDVKPEDIPASVWLEVDQGKNLTDAYRKHENQLLRDQLAAVSTAKQIEQQNADNAASSTGSVTGQGSVDPSFITAETFEKNRSDAGWVKRNFSKIVESRAKW